MAVTFKYENLHPNVAAVYRSKVVSGLSIGDNVVLKQASSAGCVAVIVTFFSGVGLCWLSGWPGFAAMLLSLFVYWPAKKAQFDSAIVINLDRIEMLKAVLPSAVNTPTENAYVQAVISAVSGSEYGDSATLDIVRQMNDLLTSFYELEVCRKMLVAAKGDQDSKTLRYEMNNVERRIERSPDQVLLNSLRQASEIYESQISDVEATETAIERVETQQLVVKQTLSSVKSTIGRAQAAMMPLKSPDLEFIRATVNDVKNQTRAVEQAVQEVVMLGR